MKAPDTVSAYHREALELSRLYETVDPAALFEPVTALLPDGAGALALDIGAGSGRDAAWLARRGFDVVAVEPAAAMRREASARHDGAAIRWLDDRLPDLAGVHRLGLGFDLILMSAVWMHVPPADRARAFRKVVTLLKAGGTLLVSLREGPAPPDRPMWPTPLGEIEGLAQHHGLAIVKIAPSEDRLGRDGVRWTTVCLRLPDDGAGALPLIRGIILNDRKSASYKLALLRAVARIADTAPSLARPRADADMVDLPFGLVALFWVRMYLPLVAQGLPQAPGNTGPGGLGFAGQGFRALLEDGVVGQDLRIGARFTGARAAAVARALGEARTLIANMPARYTTWPNADRPVFETAAAAARPPRGPLLIEEEVLAAYGTFSVPGPVWRSLQRLGAWVEPVLVAEWARLMGEWSAGLGRPLGLEAAQSALTWLDPLRDTGLARSAAAGIVDRGGPLACVWSGTPLRRADSLDIDHCLPWSAWPCGDLWNLLPASRTVNQHQKKDRLPSVEALAVAREPIIEWWTRAWFENPALRERFDREAAAALPVSSGADAAAVFDGLAWRRLRLRQDQQVAEWTPAGATAAVGQGRAAP